MLQLSRHCLSSMKRKAAHELAVVTGKLYIDSEEASVANTATQLLRRSIYYIVTVIMLLFIYSSIY